ncbi:MAG: TGS domain-containing protein [Candidatus Altiarchaeota archaeon]|nr:TGS domain-containing protein [Candidatus Altiarchaeota archaeon]
MPDDQTQEFDKKYSDYKAAQSTVQKIRLLQELISQMPKHKGTENLQAQLKRSLSKLKTRAESEKKSGKGGTSIMTVKKIAPFIVIIGPPNSGKTSLFKALTGKGKPRRYAFSTKIPNTAIAEYKKAKLQLVDTPSFDFSMANNANVIILTEPNPELEKKFKRKRIVIAKGREPQAVLEAVWERLELMRIFTDIGGEPILLKHRQTVKDAADKIHKSFVEGFEWAKVKRGKRTFRVGLDYVLHDDDMLWLKSRL